MMMNFIHLPTSTSFLTSLPNWLKYVRELAIFTASHGAEYQSIYKVSNKALHYITEMLMQFETRSLGQRCSILPVQTAEACICSDLSFTHILNVLSRCSPQTLCTLKISYVNTDLHTAVSYVSRTVCILKCGRVGCPSSKAPNTTTA